MRSHRHRHGGWLARRAGRAAPSTPEQKPPDAAETGARAPWSPRAPKVRQDPAALVVEAAGGRLCAGHGVVGGVRRRTGTVYLLQRGDKADPVLAVDRRRHGAALVGQGSLRDAARHPRRPAGQRLDHRRRQLARHQVLARGHGAARHRGRRPADAVPQQLLRHDRHRVCRQRSSSSSATATRTRGSSSTRPTGRSVREWGTPGTGPGPVRAAAFDSDRRAGVVYVADRENGRVQRFDQTGTFLGEWTGYRQDVRPEGRRRRHVARDAAAPAAEPVARMAAQSRHARRGGCSGGCPRPAITAWT